MKTQRLRKLPRRKTQYIGACLGCDATISEGKRRKYCTLECGARANRRRWADGRAAVSLAKRSAIRPCKNTSCQNTVTGNIQRLFCSEQCNQAVNRRAPTAEATKKYVKAAYRRRVKSSPVCTVCGETTARRGSHTSDTRIKHANMVPPDICLCGKHFHQYAGFIASNGLGGKEADDVFALWLTRLALGRRNYTKLGGIIRSAFGVELTKTNLIDRREG